MLHHLYNVFWFVEKNRIFTGTRFECERYIDDHALTTAFVDELNSAIYVIDKV